MRKRTDNEWTTLRVKWTTKDALVKLGIGRETDDEILQRLLKKHKQEIVEIETSPEMKAYIDKLNGTKRTRKR
jgi:hypothetical protein